MSSLVAKAAGGIGCAILALPLLAAFTLAARLGGLSSDGSMAASPSKHALADIPANMLALYQRAAPECPGLSWTILAAIGKVETDHARHPTMTSTAGAVGPMQFLPSTFHAYAHPVPPGGKNPPTPWDAVDAVYAAARLLCANDARNSKNLRSAIWHYNHDDTYVGGEIQGEGIREGHTGKQIAGHAISRMFGLPVSLAMTVEDYSLVPPDRQERERLQFWKKWEGTTWGDVWHAIAG
ncbi:transglycosylase SLT domain-containing protein [Streptomyces colonosanans]|uniref:transglycosylase SLT domain-containing protein n=1 Tax=Streptomyces colonosanans TaxID=1428652 RepID=UPI0009A0FE97|nr:transglycosylase SLT domain-containing protein [Streptomyces colonosanans]